MAMKLKLKRSCDFFERSQMRTGFKESAQLTLQQTILRQQITKGDLRLNMSNLIWSRYEYFDDSISGGQARKSRK